MREKTTVKRCWKIGAARSLLLQPSTILSKSLKKKICLGTIILTAIF